MTPEELAAARLALHRARQERARRWANAPSMHGYPALADEDETEATLAAEPPERAEKRPKATKED